MIMKTGCGTDGALHRTNLDRVEISCTKRGQLQVVVCGAGAARPGIIVRGKPDKLDLSRGLICLDTNKIYKYILRIKILNLNIYTVIVSTATKTFDNTSHKIALC